MSERNAEQITRACMVIQGRLLEISERLSLLPEKLQHRLVPCFWKYLQRFLTPAEGEPERLTLVQCRGVHQFLDKFEELIDHEVEGEKLNASMEASGHAGIARVFDKLRDDLIFKTD